MQPTRPSLLLRVRDAADDDAWRSFDEQYRGLVLGYGRRLGLQPADAEDVRQQVMLDLARALRAFSYEPRMGRFRDYLGCVVRNAIARHLRRAGRVEQALETAVAEDLDDDSLERSDAHWEEEWMHHHLRRALDTVGEQSEAKSVRVFERLLEGASVAEVAHEFESTSEAVHKVKQRMRERLRAAVALQVAEEEFPERDPDSGVQAGAPRN